ncbi:MAG TPA: choice-of-anchor Q domain-containing protein [Lacipirellula sp.]
MRGFRDSWMMLFTGVGLLLRKRSSQRIHSYQRRAHFEQFEDRQMLASFTVTSPADNEIAGDGVTTLREAVAAANQDTAPDTTIDFSIDPAHGLNGGTIALTEGELFISDEVTIDASMLPAGITLDGSQNFDVRDNRASTFRIDLAPSLSTDNKVALKNLTMINGEANSGGAIVFFTSSLGPNEFAILSLQDCVLRDNHAGIAGGAIAFFRGQLEIERTIIEENSASTNGGGIYVEDVEDAIVTDSQLLNNTATFNGGGMAALLNREADLTLQNCLVAGNDVLEIYGDDLNSGVGGGLFIDLHGIESAPTLNVINTMIVENTAVRDGGGAYIVSKFPGQANISHSSIVGNMAGSETFFETLGRGGGLWISSDPLFGADLLTVNIEETTISGNSALVEGGGVWVGMTPWDNPLTTGLADADFNFVTITNNWAPDGGGLFSDPDATLQRVSTALHNSIVSGNREAELITSPANNIAGAIESTSSFNLLGTSTATRPSTASPLFNIYSDAPALSELGYHGGPILPGGQPMLTHQPLHNSPAVDAGDPSAIYNPTEFDQRGPGFPRVFDLPLSKANRGPVDIGATEVGLAKVVDVIISGSASVHDPFSYSQAFAQGIHQFRTVPVGGADTLEIVFSEWVDVASTDLVLVGGQTGITYTGDWNIVDYQFDPLTFTARWRFDSPDDADSLANRFPTDIFEIGLNVDGPRTIHDAYGNALDSEWGFVHALWHPSRSFPSGDGAAGGAFYFIFVILPGDIDLDNVVAGVDFLTWQQMLDPGPNSTFTDGDCDGDGDVDSDDLAIWSANFGKDFTMW